MTTYGCAKTLLAPNPGTEAVRGTIGRANLDGSGVEDGLCACRRPAL